MSRKQRIARSPRNVASIRYTARGAVSLERLMQDANGDLVSTFTHPWSDGSTGRR